MLSLPSGIEARRRIFGRRRGARFSLLLVFWACYLVLLCLGGFVLLGFFLSS